LGGRRISQKETKKTKGIVVGLVRAGRWSVGYLLTGGNGQRELWLDGKARVRGAVFLDRSRRRTKKAKKTKGTLVGGAGCGREINSSTLHYS
jgi:hypothetical protein